MEANQEQRVRKDIRKALSYKKQVSAKESKRRGKALRELVPHACHEAWQVQEHRNDAIDLLSKQDEGRAQELVPIRKERMAASPFAFFRGAAVIMANDLARTPSTGIRVQACGDAHVANFGLFHSPERKLIFDITDFDETEIAPWEWDVKRLGASLEICGRERGFDSKVRRAIVKTAAEAYREAMRKFARMGTLDVWYAHMDADELYERMAHKASKSERKEAEELLDKARSKNSARAIKKLTEVVDGELRIVNEPPLIVPLREIVRQYSGMDVPDPDMHERERITARLLSHYRKNLPDDRRRLCLLYTSPSPRDS